VLQSIDYIIKEALNSCSNNPTSISVPLVRLMKICVFKLIGTRTFIAFII